MNDFKKKPFGGRDNRGGGNFGNKREFGRPSFGGDRGRDSGPKEMFQAICASCGKTCEVPFKPNGRKPVYCKECFAANGGQDGGSRDFAPKRDFGSKPSFNKPQYNNESKQTFKLEGSNGIGDLKKQMEFMNIKLDKLIEILSDKAPANKSSEPTPKPVAAVIETPEKKKSLKKAAPKKKK